jgi:mRNA interferase RelE/StbE
VSDSPRWQVVFGPSAARFLRRHPERVRFEERIAVLAAGPGAGSSKPLRGRAEWSLRVGEYRVLFQVDEARHVIVVVRIGARGDVYKGP